MQSTEPSCSLAYCNRKRHARGYCDGHYQQMKRGVPFAPLKPKTTGSLSDRLAFYTRRTDGCWEWTGARDSGGYGELNVDGSPERVHRLAFRLAHGQIPQGMHIDHKCWNRACLNPAHLQAVTAKENNENRSGSTVRSKSGIRGVVWVEKKQKWLASLGHHGMHRYVGYFDSIEDAEAAVIAKRNELFTNNLADARA